MTPKHLTANKAYQILFTEYPDIVNPQQVSTMLGIGIKKTYELLHSGVIPSIRCGNHIKIIKIEVINYVLQSTQESHEKQMKN